MEIIKTLRVTFRETADGKFYSETAGKQLVVVNCTEQQLRELDELLPVLRSGNVFNLLNVNEISPENIVAEFLVFEPDYLFDISSLSECFRPYGNHFLNYTLSRLQEKEITPAILLGNTANFFIDEFVNEETHQPVDYTETMKKMFRTSAFEFTACENLKNSQVENDFFENSKKHFNNIRYAVQQFFPKADMDKEKIVLEPSFICNALGLQGRLDIMMSDYSAFIELKSGKAVEDFRSGGQFICSAENHYTQMILYLAILEFNLDLKADDIRSYLLYSKYPVLSKEHHSREQLHKALHLRNQIVAWEYALQSANNSSITEEFLNKITSANLNISHLSGKFFDNYLAPSIDRFTLAFSCLNKREKAYFLRLYTFVLKELWLSKAGEREYEGLKKASILWNASFEDKLFGGELLYDLRITENHAAEEKHTIHLEVPVYKDLYLPNFRPGDAVVLYERNSAGDMVNNRQVFKGAIEMMDGNLLIVRLRYRQKNLHVWNSDALYAVEHDYMDTTFTGMFRALASFIHGNRDRRELLTSPAISQEIEGQTCNDKPFQEVFLLIGPPGTGKTSMALKQMVETELQKNKTNILLLSYTNRAVDEICKALSDISRSLPYIRVGSELNCAPEYRPQLLEKWLKKCNNRKDVEEVISRCRIFIGTVASVGNKPELFHLKHFDLAIIDEATQLLEPHLLGVFCARNASGRNAVERFVLIGDYKQLPAIVLQTKEESCVNELILNEAGLTDLSHSLFERFYRKYSANGLTHSFETLTRQGRMHPAISAFPSEHFYESNLKSVGLPHQTEEWIHRRRLHFYSVKPSENDFSEKANRNEASKVVEICLELYRECQDDKNSFDPQSIGIITPYRNQIALIRKQLQETGIDLFSKITVDTVERFQGSQRDTIIYSFCIKTENQLKALPNWMEEHGKRIDRKLNVALTRARKQLFLIGNENLLSQNEIYKKLIAHVKRRL